MENDAQCISLFFNTHHENLKRLNSECDTFKLILGIIKLFLLGIFKLALQIGLKKTKFKLKVDRSCVHFLCALSSFYLKEKDSFKVLSTNFHTECVGSLGCWINPFFPAKSYWQQSTQFHN